MPASPSAKDLFLDALELEGTERDQLLDRTYQVDPEMSQRVRALLASHFKMSASENAGQTWLGSMGQVPAIDAIFNEFKEDLVPGQTVGPFVLEREIGRGGFGRVWLAQQTEPVQRQVALKVLKAGLDTSEITTRFLAERQAVALMDHPGIARIFDGGATQNGLPWFAMEYIDGEPITTYCERNQIGLNQRLDLFVATCRAIHHAHQKGIIHRDIKPNNVLVTEVDGKPVPKVIDFGIAKAIEQSLTEGALETRAGQVMGTPASMSPEQVNHAADVDTRADIYSLGALLFELLCGRQPFAGENGKLPDLPDLLNQVRSVDPLRPSASLRDTPQVHVVRPKDLRGDLDWITMRCLEKDRDRRYESAAQLAADITRHTQGDTVLAGPPTFSYRATKLARRNKGVIAFVAIILVLLSAGVVVATVQATRTQVELERFEAINEILEASLMGLDPADAQGKDPELLLEILARTQKDIDAKSLHPKVEASVRRVLGKTYMTLGRYEEAEAELSRSLELRAEQHGDSHPDTYESLNDLGILLFARGRSGDALPVLTRAVQAARDVFGDGHKVTASASVSLSTALMTSGKFEQVIPDLQGLLNWHIRNLGERHGDSLLILNNLAIALSNSGRKEDALPHYRRLFAIQTEERGDSDPITLRARNNLGSLLTELGFLDEALPLLEKALAIKTDILPHAHPSLLAAHLALARQLVKMDQPIRAEQLYDEALAMGVEAHGADFRHVQILAFNRVSLLLSLDRKAEAAEALKPLLESVSRTEPEGSAFLSAVQKAHAQL